MYLLDAYLVPYCITLWLAFLYFLTTLYLSVRSYGDYGYVDFFEDYEDCMDSLIFLLPFIFEGWLTFLGFFIFIAL